MFINGRVISADADGSVMVLVTEEADLRSHGFTTWRGEGGERSIEEMTHAELIAEVVRRTMESCKLMSAADLRSRLLGATPPDGSLAGENLTKAEAADEELTQTSSGEVTHEAIDKMNFFELKRFMREQGSPVMPGAGVDADAVRKLAHAKLDEIG
jgi:hypothetical protein